MNLLCIILFISNLNPVLFEKTSFITTGIERTVLSFNEENNIVPIKKYGPGVKFKNNVIYIQVEDTIFLYREIDNSLVFRYKIVTKEILFDIDNSVYAISMKLYNKKYKDRILVIRKNNHRMVKISHLPNKSDIVFLNKEEAMKKYGVDGINGAIISPR